MHISYNIYDVVIDAGYETRSKIIKYFSSPNVNVVKSVEVVATEQNLRDLLTDSLDRGFEGGIIRQLGKGYENKRTWQLLKYKEFQDAEFVIVGGIEGKRAGLLGAFTVKLENPVIDGNGKVVTTFNCTPKASNEEKAEYLKNINNYIGQKLTVEYFELSEYGIPRFPVGKGFRNDAD